MPRFEVQRSDELRDAPGSGPGVERKVAFREDGLLVVRAKGAPGVRSSWHNHGKHDVYGCLVAGSARLEGGPGGRDAIEIRQGDFFCVPAGTVHRDVNPSATEGQEFILFLRGDGPLVVNVDGPDPE